MCARQNVTRAFSLSARRLGEGSTDVPLAQKLAEELKYEKEDPATTEAEPEFLKAFKSEGIWSIEDTLGSDEVAIVRKFGNESIRLMFSIADIANEDAGENEFDQENEEEQPEEEQTSLDNVPIRVSVSITKGPSSGSLNIDTLAQEGAFAIENFTFYPDAKVGTDLTADADWKRRGLYVGPQFDTLDEGVQQAFERYLEERGISEGLALFIPEYAAWKEQREYVAWLGNVKNFVEL
ncbi:hypothetical protein PLICRDRAFT_111642 [Plicaturopsis crispa FD-325 SS-3]|nr:hypothetical protein PLICRDRAFT_111642 [Plicaturopsis crispa FD-325 SS-3]